MPCNHKIPTETNPKLVGVKNEKKKKEDICKNFAQNHSLQIIFFQPTHCLSVKTEEVRVLKICP